MISHFAAIHHHNTIPGVYFCFRCDLSIFKGHHDGSCLESRARFHHVTDGIVAHFVIVAIVSFHHVDDGFHFTGLYFHEYCNTYSGINFFQLVYQCFLADILHAYIEG